MRFVVMDEFAAKYAGPALDDHEMDATYLGTALLGLGDMFREANRVAHPLSEKEPRVKVKEVRPGSFEVAFGIDYTNVEQAVNLLSGKYSNAGANALAFGTPLLCIVVSAVKAVKAKAAGKKVSSDELVTELKDELLVKHVNELKESRDFQKGVANLASPVLQDGIDQVDFFDPSGRNLISIDEAEALQIHRFEDEIKSDIRYETAIIEIGTPQIEKPLRRKWGLKHPDYGAINARLVDRNFADFVERGEVLFGKGRQFKTRLRVEELDLGDREYRRDFEIVEIEAIEGPTQGELEL